MKHLNNENIIIDIELDNLTNNDYKKYIIKI